MTPAAIAAGAERRDGSGRGGNAAGGNPPARPDPMGPYSNR